MPRKNPHIMPSGLFTDEDLRQIGAKGTTPERLLADLERFRRGAPPVVLDRPCTADDGIVRLGEGEIGRLSALYDKAAAAGRASKFVPASGAASRMFKLLEVFSTQYGGMTMEEIAHRGAKGEEEFAEFQEFMEGLSSFAFFEDLKEAADGAGLSVEKLIAKGEFGPLLHCLITPKGLNYSNLPKGLVRFHRSTGSRARTPVAEHLAEAAAYVKDREGRCRIHFTVSPEHELAMRAEAARVAKMLMVDDVLVETGFSVQSPATDTLAAGMDNLPFRDGAGRLLFRPGGHGALLKNLEALGGDIVFIKNIDNVVPERLRGETIRWKKALGGCLVELEAEAHCILRQLDGGNLSGALLDDALLFCRERLFISLPQGIESASADTKAAFLKERLNRPIRVCGMVKNEGEPGGGPFWVKGSDGSLSLQIVEKTQIDLNSVGQRAILDAATHFNPVDLVCGLRGYRGEPFPLDEFSDPDTAFISVKSHGGRPLKALELPGLWNGAMARWNTVFVEVPIATFTPVKTVLDLLRPEHRH